MSQEHIYIQTCGINVEGGINSYKALNEIKEMGQHIRVKKAGGPIRVDCLCWLTAGGQLNGVKRFARHISTRTRICTVWSTHPYPSLT